MNINSFLKLVEIQTKIASVTPFLLGVMFTLYHFHTIAPVNILFFFISLLCFDMFTTGLNNYNDFKKAIKKEGFNYEYYNAMVLFNLKERVAVVTIIILFLLAVIFGILTFLVTDYIVLLLGALSFSVGILYSAGPVPISRTSLGEAFSGFFMGFVIPFLTIYASIHNQKPIIITLDESALTLILNWKILLPIFLISLPAVFCIANIMLANNTCDVDDDIVNRRYTLPIQIGKKKALMLFDALYILTFVDIIVCVILGYLPWISILTLAAAIKVYKNVKAFHQLQTKKDTFALSVMNLVIIMYPIILSLLIGYIFSLS